MPPKKPSPGSRKNGRKPKKAPTRKGNGHRYDKQAWAIAEGLWKELPPRRISNAVGIPVNTIRDRARKNEWGPAKKELIAVGPEAISRGIDEWRGYLTTTGGAIMERGFEDAMEKDDDDKPVLKSESLSEAALVARRGGQMVALGQGIGRDGGEIHGTLNHNVALEQRLLVEMGPLLAELMKAKQLTRAGQDRIIECIDLVADEEEAPQEGVG